LQSVPQIHAGNIAMSQIRAWAADAANAPLHAYAYDPGPLGEEQVEIAVEYCGICHSDLSMLDNEWGRSRYPFVPGHEIVGRIVALGAQAKGRQLGQRVGLGWFSASCLHCGSCLDGDQHLCGNGEETIVRRHGGFARRARRERAGDRRDAQSNGRRGVGAGGMDF
jgi:uncharacterized zinc-type alcohol dehydrogenase-like protein